MQARAGVSVEAEQMLEQAEALLEGRALRQAMELLNRAEEQGADPDRCAGGRWIAYMLAGEFAAAWKESDSIVRRGGADPHRFWNGEAVDGRRVILRCLHGFGDAVQMLRYAPALRARCAELIVEAPPRLVDLATCFDGVDRVITWGEQAPGTAPEWDVQVEVMELPYLFRTEVTQLPVATQYLDLPTSVRRDVRQRMGRRSSPRVGLVWSAGEWNRSRSLPFAFVQEMVQATGCEFWNLQGGSEKDAWKELAGGACTRQDDSCGEGILPLAGVIEQLDLVITVDTLAAHLAGALGTPAWVLLQRTADWRWMVDRTDTPWYPSLRLYRQNTQGQWDGVVRRIAADLARWALTVRRGELAG